MVSKIIVWDTFIPTDDVNTVHINMKYSLIQLSLYLLEWINNLKNP